jgi:hypothetical protein
MDAKELGCELDSSDPEYGHVAATCDRVMKLMVSEIAGIM